MIFLLSTLPGLRPGLGPKQYKHFSYLGLAYLKEMQICVLCSISQQLAWVLCSIQDCSLFSGHWSA